MKNRLLAALIALALSLGVGFCAAPPASAAVLVCNSYTSTGVLRVDPAGGASDIYLLYAGRCLSSSQYGNIRAFIIPSGYHGISSGRCYNAGRHDLSLLAAIEVRVRYGRC